MFTIGCGAVRVDFFGDDLPKFITLVGPPKRQNLLGVFDSDAQKFA
jgi:hypothetical protein